MFFSDLSRVAKTTWAALTNSCTNKLKQSVQLSFVDGLPGVVGVHLRLPPDQLLLQF
jgi:hypothetical protein